MKLLSSANKECVICCIWWGFFWVLCFPISVLNDPPTLLLMTLGTEYLFHTKLPKSGNSGYLFNILNIF